MNIQLIEPEYIKVGECNRCGACCRMLPLWKSMNDAERALLRITGNYVASAGIKDSCLHDPNSENVFNKTMSSRCSNLKDNPDGTTSCMIYESRPSFCKTFPASPQSTIPECCIRFKKAVQVAGTTKLINIYHKI